MSKATYNKVTNADYVTDQEYHRVLQNAYGYYKTHMNKGVDTGMNKYEDYAYWLIAAAKEFYSEQSAM